MEKILYCRPASEFTIRELEARIGPLQGKYEKPFFDVIRRKIKKDPAFYMTNEIRYHSIFSRENEFETGKWLPYSEYFEELEMDFFSFDGISDQDMISLINDKNRVKKHPQKAQTVLKELDDFGRRFTTAIIDLGYIRQDLISIGYNFDKRLSFLSDSDFFESMVWVDRYETYEYDCDVRLKEALDFLEYKLSPVQFSLLRYHILSGALEKELSESNHAPYSDVEWEFLCTAQENIEQYREELRKIIFS